MNKYFIRIIFLIIVASIFNSCNTLDKKDIGELNLFEKGIEENYFISLPENYYIQKHMGPDFDVYYIKSNNLNDEEMTHGGLYFGNHPSLFGNDEENNLKYLEDIYCNIFSTNRKWKIYNKGNNYFAETIVKNKGGQEWERYIHIWVNGETKEELYRRMYLYTTLKK